MRVGGEEGGQERERKKQLLEPWKSTPQFSGSAAPHGHACAGCGGTPGPASCLGRGAERSCRLPPGFPHRPAEPSAGADALREAEVQPGPHGAPRCCHTVKSQLRSSWRVRPRVGLGSQD